MNLHEYQAKQLFSQYGIPVPQNRIATSALEAAQLAPQLGAAPWVVKAQVHAGGRGKAGGVKLCYSVQEVEAFATTLLGSNLVTYQTDSKGQPVNVVLVEEVSAIDKELYVAAVIDRSNQRLTFIASTEGGMDIEKVAEQTPERIHHIQLIPMLGIMPYQCRQVAFQLGLQGEQIKQFTHILTGLAQLFIDKDLSLIEVNPLVITKEGQLICLDGKINVDSNAAYRQQELWQMRDISQEDKRENEAAKYQLNYVSLDGNIGCMVNGAGLAMATMDTIKLFGGEPANFLDVGGGATAERVAEAFKLILSDRNVKAILINIFGGIVRCDLIAEGIIQAAKEVQLAVPLIVRLEGNQADKGSALLQHSDVNIITATNLAEAAKKAVQSII